MAAAKNLLEAVLAVQAEAPTLPKNTENTFFKSKYTPLDTIVEIVGPLLNKNGLVWMAFPARDEHGDPALHYTLEHAPSAEKREGTMPLLLSKQDAQGQGSAITYARRYALCAVLNLVADDDDDGARAAASKYRPGQQETGDFATSPQKKLLRTLITQHSLDADAMTTLLKRVGLDRSEGEKVNDAVNRLTKHQCSKLIETIKDGPIQLGGSDVPPPADDDFRQPPGETAAELLTPDWTT